MNKLKMATSKDPLLHIVTPVFNEGDNFPKLYSEINRYIKTPHELIVVYDFDKDNTIPVAKKFAKSDKTLKLHKNNLGKGALNAIKAGFNHIKSGPVLIIMADLSDDLRIVDKMYQEYLKGAEVICGSRYMKGGKQIGGPLIKRTLSRLAGISLFWIRRVPTHDITNNFRLYDKSFLDTITIESTGGFEVAMEITVKAFRHNRKIVEVPCTWRDRTAGEANFNLWGWLPSYLHWYFYSFGRRSKS